MNSAAIFPKVAVRAFSGTGGSPSLPSAPPPTFFSESRLDSAWNLLNHSNRFLPGKGRYPVLFKSLPPNYCGGGTTFRVQQWTVTNVFTGNVTGTARTAGLVIVLSISASKIFGSPESGVSTTLIGTTRPKSLA
jgi:hypothetical protein